MRQSLHELTPMRYLLHWNSSVTSSVSRALESVTAKYATTRERQTSGLVIDTFNATLRNKGICEANFTGNT